ncbi:DNA-directed RNA polymerase subunit alpha [Mesoplasma coleopterae]|uniref:DNA-directed RNA polymerase subunit alpha n=1 Tax=Mesoplasma coleopterae TaxID=324078 RepID=A0A2K8P2F8_9MOLU|nr:DNA-directed RNA polymerase subunit alpha [Mesoplasma coleopterae]ATZ20678.1 DNA-directed RNA polymerase subunit alpha [Mesoplasma coleopterae]AVN62197.1 DNA-directed RNA polymerase subunit alpha [Mesoplasma coleopterae]AVN62861.1 DNA-directed RNA polymerase subunit alpha [Mesoplasma coleopterae]
MKQFNKPEFGIVKESPNKFYGKFEAAPLERGFAVTLGNALRRTLLSSTPGASVFAIKIAGAQHEFTSISGIEENVTRIVLNVKKLILKIDNAIYSDDETVELKVGTSTIGPVTAGSLVLPAGVEVLNKDLVIANVAEGGNLDLVLYAKNSRGYKTFKENKELKDVVPGMITIDSNYSPIIKVAYGSTPINLGKAQDFEKLILEVETDGSILASDAVSLASKILISHFDVFTTLAEEVEEVAIMGVETVEEKELDKPVEELEFTQRSLNCLKRAGISTLRELVSKTEDEIQDIRNLGRKSLKEIKDKVATLELTFKQN